MGLSRSALPWSIHDRRAVREALLSPKTSFDSAPELRVICAAIKNAESNQLAAVVRDLYSTKKSVNEVGLLGELQAILIKPVSDTCNLRCTYCYEGDDASRSNDKVMSYDLLEKVLAEALESSEGRIQFAWHGGEPTLAGIDFFKNVVEIQARYSSSKLQIRNVIQTNGTLINGEWLDFFSKYRFHVGVSLDGPEGIHNSYRVGNGGRGSHDRVMSTIRMLQDKNIEFGVITVLHDGHIGRSQEYLEFMVSNGIKNFDIHPNYSFPQLIHPPPLSPGAFAEFAIGLFDAWLSLGVSDIRIGFFDDFFSGFVGLLPKTCYQNGSCTKIAAVESNGDVIPCTRPFDKSDYVFGNLSKHQFKEILASDKWTEFKEFDTRAQLSTESCPWHSICFNGCPQHRIRDGEQRIDGDNYYCACVNGTGRGHADFWSYALETVRSKLASF